MKLKFIIPNMEKTFGTVADTKEKENVCDRTSGRKEQQEQSHNEQPAKQSAAQASPMESKQTKQERPVVLLL